MALPTLAKTWNFNVNNPSPGAYSVANWQTFWWDLKEGLLNISPGWTVAGSGGAGAGGGGAMDAVDRWVVSTDITAFASTGQANNWVVLQNDNIRTGFQMLLMPKSNAGGWDGAGLRVQVSPGGNFTGGGETTLPTATDSIVIREGDLNNGSSPVPPVWHLMMSSDGELTRIWGHIAGATRFFILMDLPIANSSGWTDPWVGTAILSNITTGVPRYDDLEEINSFSRTSAPSVSSIALYWTSEGWNSDSANSAAGKRLLVPNPLDGNAFPMPPIGLASETTGAQGRHGELVDIWWASEFIPDSAHYPDTLPREFVQLGHIILPWDQTAGAVQKV